MDVCIVGSGGREAALAAVLSRTARRVVVTPGNPGIAGATPTAPEEINADLFVIGPEAPLVTGLADRLRGQGKLVVGPGADGARLEGSKAWMKGVLAEAGVPTARYREFRDRDAAVAYLRAVAPPYVIKTDGLAAGKGVLVTESLSEAIDDVSAKLAGESFGDAGRTVVIEEGLAGEELSLLCLCDGQRAVPLAPAQDFKRLADGDAGPNTGGMGAYSPVPAAGPAVVGEVMERAVEPTLAALRRRGVDYRGVLYAGLMLTDDGPKVLEYNVRFGDPETQVVLPRFAGDLAELLAEAAGGRLKTEPRWTEDAAVTVVLAAAGYPSSPRTGDVIEGLPEADRLPGVLVFRAAVSVDEHGRTRTAGGRVLNVTALGRDVGTARRRVYQAVDLITWPGMHCRRDIAERAAGQAVGV